ncbi:MAG: hypothetical protein KIC74_10065, partial [Neisseria sp.]|nr:hypothetical protein [Neisseria sp.]
CSSWQSFLQERPYATAYWPFSVMESCTSNANPPTFLNPQLAGSFVFNAKAWDEAHVIQS